MYKNKKAIIYNRVLQATNIMLITHKSIREIAKMTGNSKSTIHIDLTKRLSKIDPYLYGRIKNILKENKELGYIKGGMATKDKYKNK